MKFKVFKPIIWLSVLIVLISMACAGGSKTPTEAPAAPQVEVATKEPAQPPTQEPTKEPTQPPAPVDTGAITSLQEVRNAVIQIEAEGTFIDPEMGWQVNAAGRGTGFIIDPSGIAVTNNHVVTGAAILRVWVAGEDQPRNAKVLGVSECSDLAVIQITGSDFPYLKWFPDIVDVGLKAYAAGFPLGDPEFTLTDGIISKANTSGETNWASVDQVIEHTAKINPGNSGGPLVNDNGQILGVNYASVSETDQNYAIGPKAALPIIDKLRAGTDVDSIGINGMAVSGNIGDLPISGIWVQSIESGSSADKAGIEPGDILYQIENEVLALDGTMSDYCDILRSRQPSDTMQVTVIRWSDLSLHEGQINGTPLEMQGYLGDASGDTGDDTGAISANCVESETAGYIGCYDDTQTIYTEVPADWIELNGTSWTLDNETIGVAISAAPYLEDFNNYYDVSGVFFGASDTFAKWGGYIQFLDIYTEDYKANCKLDGRYDYNDGLYRGSYDAYYDCGGAGGTDAYVLSAVPITDQFASIILILIQVPKGDTATVEHIWSTFVVGY